MGFIPLKGFMKDPFHISFSFVLSWNEVKVFLHVLHAYTLQPGVPLVPSSLVEELAVIEKGIGDSCGFITLLIISSLAVLMVCSLEPIKLYSVKIFEMNEMLKLNSI